MSSQEDHSLWGTPPPQGNAQSSPQVLSTPNTSLVLAPPPRRAAAAARKKAAMSLALLEQWQNDEAPFSPEPSSPIGAASDAFFEDAAVASGSDGTSSSNGSEDESDSDSSMASMSGGGAVKTFASAQDASEEPYKACCQAGGVPNVKKGRKKWTLVCSSGAGMCPWKVDVWMLRGEREHEGQRLSAVWWCRVRNGSHVHPDALATPSPGLHPPPRPSASLSCPSPRLQFSPPMASPSQPCALPSTALSPSPPSPPRATRFGPCRQALAAAGANSGKTGDHAAPTAPPPFFPRLPSPPSRGPQQER